MGTHFIYRFNPFMIDCVVVERHVNPCGSFCVVSLKGKKRDRRDSGGDEREGQGRKRNRNEREETEEIKTFPSILTCYMDSKPCQTLSQYLLDAPVR